MADPITLMLIAGKCKDAFGNGVGGITVTVSDDRLNETLSTTSASNGEWSTNLGDLTGQWLDKDNISSTANGAGYRSVSRGYTLVKGDEDLNINQDFVMATVENTSRLWDRASFDGLVTMSRIGASYMKGAEDYTLTSSFVNQTADGEFLEIPQGSSAYITGLYAGTSADSEVAVEFRSASNEDPSLAGTTTTKHGRAIMASSNGNGFIPISPPIKIRYNASNARSVVIALKGGTGDASTVSFAGFILGGLE